jgi:hypothetical protein
MVVFAADNYARKGKGSVFCILTRLPGVGGVLKPSEMAASAFLGSHPMILPISGFILPKSWRLTNMGKTWLHRQGFEVLATLPLIAAVKPVLGNQRRNTDILIRVSGSSSVCYIEAV